MTPVWPFFCETSGLLMQSRDLIALYDPEERLRAANPAYRQVYHCSPDESLRWDEIMRRNYHNQRGPIIETQDIEAWLTTARARRANTPHRSFEVDLHDRRWILITETLSNEGWLLFHATDITSVRRSSRELRMKLDDAKRAASTDPLTGVPNRRFLLDKIEAWHALQSEQMPYGTHTLAVIDLDNFKSINGKYGHLVGDKVLVRFCRDVVESIRSVDLFGRLGGEEFILLMPNCPLHVAKARLDGLQHKISDQASIRYTFSAGLTLVRQDRDIHHAIRSADKRLFQAKSEGRARVVVDGNLDSDKASISTMKLSLHHQE